MAENVTGAPVLPEPERKPGYLEVLRDCPGYRTMFLARSISLFGDWFSLIAVIAMLRQVTGSSPGAISGILILKLLPIFLAGPLAGVVADRFNRKWIMVVSDLVRVVLVLLVIVAPMTSRPIAFAYALITLQVVASAFFEPARTAALPHLAPGRYLAAANALGAVVWSVMFALGSAIGGLVTDRLGWQVALAIDAATYAASALLVTRIALPRRRVRGTRAADWMTLTGIRDFREGIRFIAGRLDVASVLFLKAGWGLAGSVTLFLTLFGERVYAPWGRPDLGVGLLFLSRALGTALGPVFARRIVVVESPRAMRALLTVALVWGCFWYVGFSVVHHWAAAALAVVLAHFGGSIVWVYSTVLLQRMVPDDFLGRVMATDLGLATLMISTSLWVYGRLAEAPDADLSALVRLTALSLLVPAAVWWWAAGRWPVGLAAAPSPRGD